MFAVYATQAVPTIHRSLSIGERPEPEVPQAGLVEGQQRQSHRHDLFTTARMSGHPRASPTPSSGQRRGRALWTRTPVSYTQKGSDDWRGDETLDPAVAHPQEFINGTFADAP